MSDNELSVICQSRSHTRRAKQVSSRKRPCHADHSTGDCSTNGGALYLWVWQQRELAQALSRGIAVDAHRVGFPLERAFAEILQRSGQFLDVFREVTGKDHGLV